MRIYLPIFCNHTYKLGLNFAILLIHMYASCLRIYCIIDYEICKFDGSILLGDFLLCQYLHFLPGLYFAWIEEEEYPRILLMLLPSQKKNGSILQPIFLCNTFTSVGIKEEEKSTSMDKGAGTESGGGSRMLHIFPTQWNEKYNANMWTLRI